MSRDALQKSTFCYNVSDYAALLWIWSRCFRNNYEKFFHDKISGLKPVTLLKTGTCGTYSVKALKLLQSYKFTVSYAGSLNNFMLNQLLYYEYSQNLWPGSFKNICVDSFLLAMFASVLQGFFYSFTLIISLGLKHALLHSCQLIVYFVLNSPLSSHYGELSRIASSTVNWSTIRSFCIRDRSSWGVYKGYSFLMKLQN